MLLRTLTIACSIICHHIRQSNITTIKTCLPEECDLNAKYSFQCNTGLEEQMKTTVLPQLNRKQDKQASSKNGDDPLLTGLSKHRRCPVNNGYTWVSVHHLCHKKLNGQFNWFKAKTQCSHEGTGLIVLNRKAKYSSIKTYMGRINQNRKNYRVWLGMTRTGFSKRYKWIRLSASGSRFRGKWSKGEPSFGKEYCVVLTSFGMSDVRCSTHADTICELQM